MHLIFCIRTFSVIISYDLNMISVSMEIRPSLKGYKIKLFVTFALFSIFGQK